MNLRVRHLAFAAAFAVALPVVGQIPFAGGALPVQAITASGSVTELKVTGRAGVPDNASAVVLNLTASDSTEPGGFVTAYPCGGALPDASNLNYSPRAVVANSATVPVGTGGKVCLYTYKATNLIVDINGWFPANSDFTPTTPTRLLDTRTTARAGSGAVTQVQVTGPAGVANNASAVVLNLTASDSTEPGGFVTAYPCGGALPDASNLNYSPRAVVANSATVPVGTGGKVCLYTYKATNLIVDINGWFPANSDFTPTTPTRLLDTRTTARAGSGAVTQVQVTGPAGVANNASAVVLNLTASDSTEPGGFVTAYPCGGALPDASNLNYSPGAVVANSATVPVGTGGKVCLYTYKATNLIVDINGWFPANSDFTPTTPTRLLDTRTTAAPAAGGQFVETFTGNTGLERFDTGIYHRDEAGAGGDGLVSTRVWNGDHDMNCGTPDTQRAIHRENKNESFYMCRDHLMTSIGDTAGYSTGWFSPKQTFTNATKVSWDVNITNLLGRKWWEVAIVPTSFNSGVATCPRCSVISWLSPSPSGLPAYPAGSVVVGSGPGGDEVKVSTDGIDRQVAQHYRIANLDPEASASKAIRRPFSITDNRNGTITVSYAGFATYTVPGSFPAGGFNVVFKDHNYTPDKDGAPVGYTWHWDNIVVG